ncbi:MAG: RDD family protein [Phycisphaerae bacterium]
MNWYFAEAGQRYGPFTEDGFRELVAQGRILANSLMWRDGMPNWLAYRYYVAWEATVPALAPAVEGKAFCSQCERLRATDEMLNYRSAWICADCKGLYFQRIREGVGAAVYGGAMAYGGFWIRLAAKIIDALTVSIPAVIIAAIAGAILEDSEGARGSDEGLLTLADIAIIVATAVVPLLYMTVMLGRYGSTLGKMACGLRVTRSDGERLSYRRAFARTLVEIVAWVVPIVCIAQYSAAYLLGLVPNYLPAGFEREKCAIHDHICGTRVVYKQGWT